ncbi:YfiR family protein [Endozoicomonas ascidiicola]|uniref:YfiR family protein n=1 Tax=Endozoicomonas ascidiicola TaxID=1698521 RepID=UPI00082FB6C1|nr:YfiR family protein [Endozoicomonas ascidiicola]
MLIFKRPLLLRPLLALAFASVFWAPISAANEATKEDRVKAAIVFKLTKFITWPAKKQTLALCVIGSGGINSELAKINHKFSMGRRISVTHKAPAAPLDKLCDMVYVHNIKNIDVATVLKKLQKKPVLTISDNDDFAFQGGVIELFRTGSKIRFAISKGSTRNAGLSISPQLMKLAKIVD